MSPRTPPWRVNTQRCSPDGSQRPDCLGSGAQRYRGSDPLRLRAARVAGRALCQGEHQPPRGGLDEARGVRPARRGWRQREDDRLRRQGGRRAWGLLHHWRNPTLEWWRAMVVVRDTTHGFNSAQIGYLEGRLAQELRARPGVDVREGQIGQHQPRARRLVPGGVRRRLRRASHAATGPASSPTPSISHREVTRAASRRFLPELLIAGVLKRSDR